MRHFLLLCGDVLHPTRVSFANLCFDHTSELPWASYVVVACGLVLGVSCAIEVGPASRLTASSCCFDSYLRLLSLAPCGSREPMFIRRHKCVLSFVCQVFWSTILSAAQITLDRDASMNALLARYSIEMAATMCTCAAILLSVWHQSAELRSVRSMHSNSCNVQYPPHACTRRVLRAMQRQKTDSTPKTLP